MIDLCGQVRLEVKAVVKGGCQEVFAVERRVQGVVFEARPGVQPVVG